MINTYYSDKIEWLVELLAKKIQTNPPTVFEKIEISINKYLLGEWVKNQIALSNGIFAYCEIKSITELTKNLVRQIKPTENKKYWDMESLKWGIINSLGDLNEFNEIWPIEFWVKKFYDNNHTVDKSLYYFSSNIAKIFSDYLIYRPEIIYNWHSSNINSKKLFYNLEKEEYWQAILFKLLEKNKNNKFLSIDILEILKAIEKKEIINPNIPKEINIITKDNISKLYLDFYQKISIFTNVNLYILSPGIDLWERTSIINDSSYKFNKISNTKLIDPIPEIRLGQSIANFQKLIEENGISNQLNINSAYLYSDPLNSYNKEDKTLLKQIQNSIIKPTNKHFKKLNSDDSIIFKEFSNILQELEYIKLQIINLLKNEVDIHLRDIAIITPNIDYLKKHLRFIFTNYKSTGISIPFTISQTKYSDISNIFGYILQLIDISINKIDNFSLKNLLNNEAIKEIFNLEQDEINIFTNILKESGFDWGLDENDRMDEYRNSLDWSLEKIKLGLIYNENIFFKNYDLSPKSVEHENINMHKLIRVVELFIFHIKILKETKHIDEKIDSLKIILDDLFHRNYSYEINEFKGIIDEYENEHYSKQKIDIYAFREILNSIFNKNYNYLNKRNDELIISEMQPISFIPYKYIFICGMNDKFFPKKYIKENYSFIYRNQSFGDPNQTNIEKDLFLYILISCRNKLCITWSEKDSEDHKLNISTPVKRLMRFIKSNIDSEEIIESKSNINKKSLNLNKKDLFPKSVPIINNLEWEYKNNNEIFKISELQELLKGPQRYWLIKKDIRPPRRFKNIYKKEISSLAKINFFEKILNKVKIDNVNFEETILNIDLKKEIIAEGIIAPKNSIFDFEKDFKYSIISLVEILNNFKNIKHLICKNKVNRESYYISKKEIIELKHTKLNLSNIVQSWLRLLFIASQNNEIESSKIVYLKNNNYKIKELKSPGNKKAIKILNTYSNIYAEHKKRCLPIPPISSFNFISTLNFYDNEKAINIFKKTWIGNEFSLGEREKFEMKLCFGESKASEFFTNNNSFKNLADILYNPIIESLVDGKDLTL